MKNITKTKFSCLRDGLTIRGYEYRPQGEKLPIAIVSHGFMLRLQGIRSYLLLWFADMILYCLGSIVTKDIQSEKEKSKGVVHS